MTNNTYPCDNCGKPVEVKLYIRKHYKSIEENYMKCSSCDTEFISFVTDPSARQMQKEVKKHNDRLIKRKGQLQVKMDQLKQQILNERASN